MTAQDFCAKLSLSINPLSGRTERVGQIVEKKSCLSAVDDAMITGKRQCHHRADGGLTIERNNAIRDATHSENRGLRRRDDGVERIDVIHAEIGDRECAAGYVARS